MREEIKHYAIELESNGETIEAGVVVEVRDWQENGKRHRPCKIILTWGKNKISKESHSVYHAFKEARRTLENDGIQALCFGACKDVQVSGMMCDMGDGSFAYRMSKAEKGKRPPTVNIFDTEEGLIVSNIYDQEHYKINK